MQKIKTYWKSNVTWKEIIIGICVLNFALIQIIPIVLPNVDRISAAVFLGAYYKAFISGGYEIFRFLTVGFVHIDFLHLALNMMAFIQLARFCENIYTTKETIKILLISTVMGSVFVYCMSGNIVGVGLSGGLYGLFAAELVYFIATGLIRNPNYRQSLITTALINFAINLMPGVSFEAHLGGFVGGLALGVLYSKNEAWKELRRSTKVAIGMFCVVAAFWMQRSYKISEYEIYLVTDREVYKIADAVGLNFYTDWMSKQMMKYYTGLGGY